jgi:rhodanese-related sulfurtransferase
VSGVGCPQVTYAGLTDLLEAGAQLVEVLPRPDYEKLHLPGAISIPLRTLGPGSAAELDSGSPVVTYCWDSL